MIRTLRTSAPRQRTEGADSGTQVSGGTALRVPGKQGCEKKTRRYTRGRAARAKNTLFVRPARSTGRTCTLPGSMLFAGEYRFCDRCEDVLGCTYRRTETFIIRREHAAIPPLPVRRESPCRDLMKKVGVVMGSASDLPVMRKAAETLKALEIPFEVRVISAHRTPEEAARFSREAAGSDFGVLIAGAGLAAHLAGALAAQTVLPVIGIPLKAGAADGIDALLSTVQMPPGVPVACVGIDAAVNAALLAAQILAVSDGDLAGRLEDLRELNARKVRKADKDIGQEFSS